jgi:glycerol uptake facilitator-like aquaporin
MRTGSWREPAAELVGTGVLLWAIVGSGIAVTRLALTRDASALAQLVPHALAVGLTLTVLIVVLGPVSGAHFNPVVTFAAVLLGRLPRSRTAGYLAAQVVGGVLGTMAANLTFGLPGVTVAGRIRGGPVLLASEVVATLGLVLLIFVLVARGRGARPIGVAVGAYIAAAIVVTPSTSFANPAVTLARALSDTFTGIAPASVPGFSAAQLVGALLAVAVVCRVTRAGSDGGGHPRPSRIETT